MIESSIGAVWVLDQGYGEGTMRHGLMEKVYVEQFNIFNT